MTPADLYRMERAKPRPSVAARAQIIDEARAELEVKMRERLGRPKTPTRTRQGTGTTRHVTRAPRGRPSKWNDPILVRCVRQFVADGLHQAEVARRVQVSAQTLQRLCELHDITFPHRCVDCGVTVSKYERRCAPCRKAKRYAVTKAMQIKNRERYREAANRRQREYRARKRHLMQPGGHAA